MNQTPDNETISANESPLDPQAAAALLDQTTQQARRKFEPNPPMLNLFRGFVVLVAFGGLWLSVRGQHPYRGPTAADIPVLIGFIVLNFTATVAVRRRATAGVSGRSRFSQGEIMLLVVAFVATVVAMTALGTANVSFAWSPTTVLVIPGLAWAAISAARANWVEFGMGLAIVALGVVGAFAGPAGSWAVAAVGLCAVLLGNAAAIIWHLRA